MCGARSVAGAELMAGTTRRRLLGGIGVGLIGGCGARQVDLGALVAEGAAERGLRSITLAHVVGALGQRIDSVHLSDNWRRALTVEKRAGLKGDYQHAVVTAWDVAGNEVLHRLEAEPPPRHGLSAAYLSGDGAQALTLCGHTPAAVMSFARADSDWTARIFDVASGELLQQLEPSTRNAVFALAYALRWERPFADFSRILEPGPWHSAPSLFDGWTQLVIDPSQRLAARLNEAYHGRDLPRVTLHELSDPESMLSIDHPEAEYFAFSPDGTRLLTQTYDDEGVIWDTSDGRAVSRIGDSELELGVTQFSPDGSMLVTAVGDHGSWDNSLLVWRADGQLGARLHGAQSATWRADFFPDGSWVFASTSADGDDHTRIWHAASGELLAQLPGHAAKCAPDGSMLATIRENEVLVWSIERS